MTDEAITPEIVPTAQPQVDPDKRLENLKSLWAGYSWPEIAIIKKTVAKGTTDEELWYFLALSKAHWLNPFKKEIRCYKDNKGNLITMVWRDWMLSKAQSSWEYKSLNSSEVREKDTFTIDIPNQKVEHTFGVTDRWPIVWAYAILETKDGWKTITWAELKEYDKNQFIWSSHKSDMIKKVAEVKALKKRFIFAWLVGEETEWVPTQDVDALSDWFWE